MAVISHLLPLSEYEADAHRPIAPVSLETEGFVHCTGDDETLLAVANFRYRTDDDFVVLDVDTDLLNCAVVWEPAAPAPPPGVPASVAFPHVYGPIARSAIVGVRCARRGVDGMFYSFEPRPGSNAG